MRVITVPPVLVLLLAQSLHYPCYLSMLRHSYVWVDALLLLREFLLLKSFLLVYMQQNSVGLSSRIPCILNCQITSESVLF